jgi:hypothetical protein
MKLPQAVTSLYHVKNRVEASLNTVHDLFVEARALKQQGLSPRQIADRLIAMGHGMGFAVINDRGSGGAGNLP